jgi:hypothetical protein
MAFHYFKQIFFIIQSNYYITLEFSESEKVERFYFLLMLLLSYITLHISFYDT